MDTITLILFILGFVLLIGGAEFLVRGASRLALAVGISPLVVGLTVVAYGTSAPELAVTINATFSGEGALALGNIIGSNISNILLVLGLSASIAALTVNTQLIRLDVPLMIFLSVLVLLMGLDGKIGRLDGIILAAGAITYTVFVIRKSRKETKAAEKRGQVAPTDDLSKEEPQQKGAKQFLSQAGLIIVGLFLLVLGADWLIDGAVAIAELFQISQLVIGLTIVAVGTSLPEIATSIIASLRNQRDIAVGNVIGSNIFNIMLVLGVTSIVAPNGVPVPLSALSFDIPVMIAVAVATLPVFFTNFSIDRWEGVLFLGYYLAYTAYLFLNATHHYALDEFSTAMTLFFIPITVITLVVITVQAWRHKGLKQQIS